MTIDRTAVNRALSKAIAYRQCGNGQKANQWAAHLLFLLDTMDIADQRQLDVLEACKEPAK